jgi:predicted phage baseplate assembly protein
MPLPTPNLDDRRFQDLVDEAKRRVQQRCPEWTDHNVSDPGVTLIETFAFMVEQVLYRLNRVPELHYRRFLDLIGVRLFAPSTAHCDVTFWLSSAQENPVVIPEGAQVATMHGEIDEPVVFTVSKALTVVPVTFAALATTDADTGAPPIEHTEELLAGRGPSCFAATPAPGNAVYVGLSTAAPSCAVLLRMACDVEGVGVDPADPPLVWEAWDGDRWVPCDVESDTTGGFNVAGDVVLHLPSTHTVSVLGRRRAGWLRCRITQPAPHQPFYSDSPRLHAITASTIGGTVPAEHADVVRDEILGTAEGVAGQRFPLARGPVVAEDVALTVEVSSADGWQPWHEVTSFAPSGPADRHVVIDRSAGEVVFGPAIRQPDGEFRQHGAVPAKGATIRIPRYRIGGGRRGNVARGLLRVQRDPVPFVSSVINRKPAAGGVDGESVGDAEQRGPLLLRTLDRAVTAEDYEQLARQAAPEIARVACVSASVDQNGTPEGVRVLVVPAVPGSAELDFATLRVDPVTYQKIVRYLDERRCIGARLSVEEPLYRGVTVVAQLRTRAGTSPGALSSRATTALYDYLHPITGGPDGDGWPFGRPVANGEVFAVLQRVPGVEMVESVRLFVANPSTGEPGAEVPRVELPPNALVFSVGHQIQVLGE